MRIALINTANNENYAPLSLMKIGAWRKSLGDHCKIFNNKLPAVNEFDEIWITTLFTFDIYNVLRIAKEARKRAKRVWVGGISATLRPDIFEREGFEVHKGLLPEAEAFAPDYTLLDHKPTYSIVHTSRGCVRACGFCMVRILEPQFAGRDDWEKDICAGVDRVLFYDNNFTAKPIDEMKKDVAKIKDLVNRKIIKKIDFNQALDARLMTDEIADILQGVPFDPVRFAFDGMQADGYFQNAIRKMAERGHRSFYNYVLYNFKDTPADLYYRLKEHVNLREELNARYDTKGFQVVAFPMRYQPILEVDTGRNYVGDHWTEEQKKGFMNILNCSTVGGQVSVTSMQEFVYWFGADEKEFTRLLNYPRIAELCKKKKGALREKRLIKNEAKRLAKNEG